MRVVDFDIKNTCSFFLVLTVIGMATQALSQEPPSGRFQVSNGFEDCDLAWVINSSTGDLFVYETSGSGLYRKGQDRVPFNGDNLENAPPVGRFQIYPIIGQKDYIWVLDTSTGSVHYFKKSGSSIDHVSTGKLPKPIMAPTNVRVAPIN